MAKAKRSAVGGGSYAHRWTLNSEQVGLKSVKLVSDCCPGISWELIPPHAKTDKEQGKCSTTKIDKGQKIHTINPSAFFIAFYHSFECRKPRETKSLSCSIHCNAKGLCMLF